MAKISVEAKMRLMILKRKITQREIASHLGFSRNNIQAIQNMFTATGRVLIIKKTGRRQTLAKKDEMV